MLKIHSKTNFLQTHTVLYAEHFVRATAACISKTSSIKYLCCMLGCMYNIMLVCMVVWLQFEAVVRRYQTHWYDLMLVMILAYSNRQTENVESFKLSARTIQFCVYVNAHMYSIYVLTVYVRLKIPCAPQQSSVSDLFFIHL